MGLLEAVFSKSARLLHAKTVQGVLGSLRAMRNARNNSKTRQNNPIKTNPIPPEVLPHVSNHQLYEPRVCCRFSWFGIFI